MGQNWNERAAQMTKKKVSERQAGDWVMEEWKRAYVAGGSFVNSDDAASTVSQLGEPADLKTVVQASQET